MNPEIYFLEKIDNKLNKKYFDIFFYSKYGICNLVVFNLWKKKIKIFPFYLIEPTYNLLIKLEKQNSIHTIPYFQEKTRFVNIKIKKDTPNIKLNEFQEKNCEEILNKNNIDIKNIKYVCLFNRDDAYLNSFKNKKDWYYLSHHNYKIKSFEYVAKKLVERNIFFFRMGAIVEDKFNLNNPKIIDYANSSFRSELMDFYLASKCMFGISGGTGSSIVSMLYRKPILDLNANLHHLVTFLDNSVLLSKHYYDRVKKKNLSLKEILSFKEHEFKKRNQLDKKNIEMIDCTPEEISEAAIEMLDRLEDKWEDNTNISELQNKFRDQNWQNIYQERNGVKNYLHEEIKAKYSSKYLIKNPNWLD
tara:strand:+ start:10672 stop:11751 length:1080 start_codon:yes stop_codon:yes gene_type:complete